ncbi:hypothetical protein MSG28_011118, partial [Choristoneura fumiferana]
NARKAVGVLRDFSVCHDDFSLKPPDGILREGTFTWLAFVQYVHGIPHQNKAPRLVLIHQQFVVGAATDLLHLPKNYKLGNIMFGDYARDEEDCGLAGMQLKMGERCARAYLEMPFSDVTPHPEYSRFGVGNSLALVKLMRSIKSAYTIPICLPSLTERLRKRKNKIVFMVDYISCNYCYKSLRKQARKSSMFYSEKFEVNANPAAKLHINMKISAGIETTIVCARLLLPNRLTEPNIYGVGGYNITVTFTTHWFPYNFEFYLGLAGRNTSAKDFTAWLSERQPGFW